MSNANHRFRTLLTVLVFLCCHSVFSQSGLSKKQRTDSTERANYRKQYEFLNLSETDTAVDIGTGAGYNLARIAGHFPNIHFVAEDVDSSYSNKALFAKIAGKIGVQPNMANITFQTGSETATGLPPATFSKVLAFDVIHEMTYKAGMLADIRRILKQNGSLLISEILVHKTRKRAKTCRYPFLTEPKLKAVLASNGFEIVREQLITEPTKDRLIKMYECRVKSN